MHTWIEVCAVCETETALFVGISSTFTKCVYVSVHHQSDYNHPKKQWEFISFMCQSTFIQTQIFAFFRFANVSFQAKIPTSNDKQENRLECKRRESHFRIYSNPIRCKWPFEMFVKGFSNCIYSPIIMRPLWFRVTLHSSGWLSNDIDKRNTIAMPAMNLHIYVEPKTMLKCN